MAEVLSTAITNIEASPMVKADPWEGPRPLVEVTGVATTSSTQADTDIIRFVRVPSNARISQVLLSHAVATTAGAVNIGLYNPNTDGGDGLVVDADLFGSAVALTGSARNNADVTFESGEYTYAESEKPLWEVLGLTSDPHLWYDVVADVSTTFVAGPTSMKVNVRYTV